LAGAAGVAAIVPTDEDVASEEGTIAMPASEPITVGPADLLAMAAPQIAAPADPAVDPAVDPVVEESGEQPDRGGPPLPSGSEEAGPADAPGKPADPEDRAEPR